MRLKLLLELDRPTILPWDYKTALSRLIYHLLERSDPSYARWLLDHGYRLGHRVYRMFAFSDLQAYEYVPQKEGLLISRAAMWEIASPDERFIRTLEQGLRNTGGTITVAETPLHIVDVLLMPTPQFSTSLTFRTVSPIIVSSQRLPPPSLPIYLSPDDPQFVLHLERNLLAKWEAFTGTSWKGAPVQIRVWQPRSRLVKVFGVNVRAWELRGQIWGPSELVTFAYDAGLGEKNSQGYGMLEAWR